MPSLEATLTKPASLHDHLAWQLKITNIGVTLFSLGRKDAALVEWQHVLTIDPNNKSAKLYLKMANDANGPRPGSALPR